MGHDFRRWIRLVETGGLMETMFYRGSFKPKYSDIETHVEILKKPLSIRIH